MGSKKDVTDLLPGVLTPERLACLNVHNEPDEDGAVRGRVLPNVQPPFNKAVALITLVIFVSWPYFMFALMISSAFFFFFFFCVVWRSL